MSKLIRFLLFLVINFGALVIGSFLMNNGPTSDWYIALNKAPWSPPGWFFGVAWTTIMICFSIYLMHLVALKSNRIFWSLFVVQFLLNTSWNYVFFNQHLIGVGLLVIVLLTILVGYFFMNYLAVLGKKSWFIVPYFSWLLVATSLNAYVLMNN